MGGVVNTITAGTGKYKLASTAYAFCSSGSEIPNKIATIYDAVETNSETLFSLIDGVTVQVLFQNSNTASSPTLNVNSTGAIPIYIAINTPAGNTSAASWPANSIVSLTCTARAGYNGYVWLIHNSNNRIIASNDSTNKLYLLGTPSQEGGGVYSKQYIYADENGDLYSNDNKVITEEDIGTAATANIDTVIDPQIPTNNLPTTTAILNLVSDGLTNVEQKIENDSSLILNNQKYGVLLSNSYVDETNIDSVIKSDKLKYNFLQKTLSLSDINEYEPSESMVFNVTPEYLSFQSGIIEYDQVEVEQGEDPIYTQNYDNYNGINKIGIDGIKLSEKVIDENDQYQFINSSLTGNTAHLGGILVVDGNTTLNQNLTVNEQSILNNTLTVMGSTSFEGDNNTFYVNQANYPLLIGEYTAVKSGNNYRGLGFGLTYSNPQIATWESIFQYNSFTWRRYIANQILTAEMYINFTGNSDDTTKNQSIRITKYKVTDNLKQKDVQTVLTPTRLYMRGNYTTKTNIQDSQNYQSQTRVSCDTITFRKITINNNGTTTENNQTVTWDQIANWDTTATNFNKIKSSVKLYNTNSSATSITADQYIVYSNSKTLTKGLWLIHGACRFATNSSGFRSLGVSTTTSTSSGSFITTLTHSQPGFSGENNYITVNGLYQVTSNSQTLYLKAHSSVQVNCTFLGFNAIQLYAT